MLPILIATCATGAQVLTFCPPPPGSDATFSYSLRLPMVVDGGGQVTTPSPAAFAVVLLVSPDGGALWDKTCGYPYHHACETPFLLLGDIQGPTHGYPVDALGGGTAQFWATAPEDVAAGWMQLLALPRRALEAEPYALFLQ